MEGMEALNKEASGDLRRETSTEDLVLTNGGVLKEEVNSTQDHLKASGTSKDLQTLELEETGARATSKVSTIRLTQPPTDNIKATSSTPVNTTPQDSPQPTILHGSETLLRNTAWTGTSWTG